MGKQLFGTDGIRGVPGEFPLDDATLVRVGAALGHYLHGAKAAAAGQARKPVLIGRDTRESGPHIAAWIAAGLAAEGAIPSSAGTHHARSGLPGAQRRICGRGGDFRFAQPLPRQRREALPARE